jgi:hypothetical protein
MAATPAQSRRAGIAFHPGGATFASGVPRQDLVSMRLHFYPTGNPGALEISNSGKTQ